MINVGVSSSFKPSQSTKVAKEGGVGGGRKRESKKVGSRESMREIIHSFALLSKKWKVTGVRGTKTGEHVSKAKGSPLPASLPVN